MLPVPDPLRTERLLLCRPRPGDLPDVHDVHADPATNRHNPAGPSTDRAANAAVLDGWIAHWERHGFGYWTVRDAAEGGVLGFGGLQRRDLEGEAVLNLYYRFRPQAWGHGYAGETARAALDVAAALGTGEPVVAVVRESNLASQRVARGAGLIPTTTVRYGGEPSLVFRWSPPTG